MVVIVGKARNHGLITRFQLLARKQALQPGLNALVLRQHLGLLAAAIGQAQGEQLPGGTLTLAPAIIRKQLLQLGYLQIPIANSTIRQRNHQPPSHGVVVIRPVALTGGRRGEV
ncbi:hypothetical protein EA796_18080 [Pseudomonas sp. AOB-7]|nr:hypothetical protein EA796_18080 [Pseudomonas sp. AOB-7]